MKHNRYFLTILVLLGINAISCNLLDNDDKPSTVYYKSYYLGEDNFKITGRISDLTGQNLPSEIIGNNIVAKMYHLNYDWKIKSSLNGNNFDFQISKTSDDGIVLSKDLSSSHSIYEYFINYFHHLSIPSDSPQGLVKIYTLSFELDNGSDLNEYGFSREVSFGGIDELYYYVYVTEPVDISGNFHWKDEYDNSIWYYECNFSQAGWYKLSNFYGHSIGNNSNFSSSTNIILRKYR